LRYVDCHLGARVERREDGDNSSSCWATRPSLLSRTLVPLLNRKNGKSHEQPPQSCQRMCCKWRLGASDRTPYEKVAPPVSEEDISEGSEAGRYRNVFSWLTNALVDNPLFYGERSRCHDRPRIPHCLMNDTLVQGQQVVVPLTVRICAEVRLTRPVRRHHAHFGTVTVLVNVERVRSRLDEADDVLTRPKLAIISHVSDVLVRAEAVRLADANNSMCCHMCMNREHEVALGNLPLRRYYACTATGSRPRSPESQKRYASANREEQRTWRLSPARGVATFVIQGEGYCLELRPSRKAVKKKHWTIFSRSRQDPSTKPSHRQIIHILSTYS